MTSPDLLIDHMELSSEAIDRMYKASLSEDPLDTQHLQTLDWHAIARSEDGACMLGCRAFLFLWEDYRNNYRNKDSLRREGCFLEKARSCGVTCIRFRGGAAHELQSVPCLRYDGVWYRTLEPLT